jgi:hypothetical protein
MAKRTSPVASRGGHFTNKKGDKKRGAPPGNTNTANGPRLGRQGKPATSLPQPHPDAKLPQRRHRAKTGGRDFVKGANSHDGEVFRRTEDQLPRGNFTLFAKCVHHDERETLYRRFVQIGRTGTNREVLALAELLGNRIDGLPTKKVKKTVHRSREVLALAELLGNRIDGLPTEKVEKTVHRSATFVFTNPDGSLTPALPQKVGRGATPAAASAEDAITLQCAARARCQLRTAEQLATHG